MNMEKLSIKSLQIGDWVIPHIFDSKLEPSKIVGIHYNSYKGKDYVDWVDCEVWGEFYMDDIEPIPLTLEILEKNGWHCYNSYGQFDCNRVPFEFKTNKDGGFIMIIPADDFGLTHFLLFEYVHELQHALRLCGIEKEIEL